MKDLQYYLKDIYSTVWDYNNYWDKGKNWETELSRNPEEVALVVKNYALTVRSLKRNKELIGNAVEQICKYTTPENIDSAKSKGVSRFKNDPKRWIEDIIDDCSAIINIVKTDNDSELPKLNEEWCGKYLYFNGDEAGTQIICPESIYYEDEKIVFDGVMISFENENTSDGIGVIVSRAEGYNFQELHYIDYVKEDYEKNEEFEDEDLIYPAKLHAQLSSPPIDTDMESRIMTKEEVYKEINDYITSAIEEEM